MQLPSFCNLFFILCCVSCEPESPDAGIHAKAIETVRKWAEDSTIPLSDHVTKQLADYPLANIEKHCRDNRDGYAHCAHERTFNDEDAQQALEDIGGLLRRGLNRLVGTAVALLEGGTVEDSEVQFVLTRVRAIQHSFEDFWTQAQLSWAQGPSQLENLPEHAEYGPETNFWLKFRPYLLCSRVARLGPELGGVKNWCNPEWFQKDGNLPKAILSAGSGAEFMYEDFAMAHFPDAKVVVFDCYFPRDSAFNDPNTVRDPDKLKYVELCLSGKQHMDSDQKLYSKKMAEKFQPFDTIMEKVEKDFAIGSFDLHKVNIEAYEYPFYGDILQDPDKHLANTKQIHMEMHRKGMQRHGLSWTSMIYLELLYATFMSAGFHSVSSEHWFDSTAAQEVTLVNQTWFLESELAAYRDIWSPMQLKRSEEAERIRGPSNWKQAFFGNSKREEL